MSSKRGRKRNDNLPPNRARDVQRAFRARRAAHLQALEQRVQELEDENICLRQALNLPPSNRPALGKGPTGKDKPKSFDLNAVQSSRESSSADSPGSTGSGSLSPSAITETMSSRTMQLIDNDPWDQPLVLHDPVDTPLSPPIVYQPAPVPASISTKYPPYTNALPSASRSQLPNNMYMPAHQNYPHTEDRPMGNVYSGSGYILRDAREDPREQPFSYSQSLYQSQVHSHSPPTLVHSLHSQPHAQSHAHHLSREPASAGLSYAHRRAPGDTQNYPTIVNQFPHLPAPHQAQQGMRPPSAPQAQDNGGHLRPAYSQDGRLHHI